MPVFYHWETNLLLDRSGTLQEIPERPRKGRNEKPGELIAWQSLPGADVQSAGSVHFSPIGGGESTRVKVALQYLPPVGKVGAFVAHLLGSASEQQLEFLPQPILKSTRNLGLAFLRGYAKNPWMDVGSKVRLVT